MYCGCPKQFPKSPHFGTANLRRLAELILAELKLAVTFLLNWEFLQIFTDFYRFLGTQDPIKNP